jgi:hypothetical protein
MVDLDEGRNRVSIGITDESARPSVVAVLSRLPVPGQAFEITVTGAIKPL